MAVGPDRRTGGRSRRKSARTRLLGAIHMAARERGLIQDTAAGTDKVAYVAMLNQVAGVSSAAELDAAGLARVLDHLKPRRHSPRRRISVGPEKEALCSKIRALLFNAVPTRTEAYADGMARRMFSVERYEWCEPDQLRRLVAALEYDKARHQPEPARA